MAKKIFPDIGILYTTGGIKLYTDVRKQYAGKWYLWHFWRDCAWQKDKTQHALVFEVMQQFIKEIYLVKLFGIADIGAQTDSIFELDQNQESEEDRIQKTLIK